MTKEELIEQEAKIKEHWEAGDIPYLCHLMGGNEDQLIKIFKEIDSRDFVFASHRCHYHYALHGETDLIAKVLSGKSMFLYKENFICSAIVGGILSMACGVALSFQQKGSTRKVWAFCGDGATDQGAFWEAVRFAEGRDLPITFIVEDNGGQCGVDATTRWGGTWPYMQDMVGHKHIRYYHYVPTYPHAGTNGPDGRPTRPNLKLK